MGHTLPTHMFTDQKALVPALDVNSEKNGNHWGRLELWSRLLQEMRTLVYHIPDESHFTADLITHFGCPATEEDANSTEVSESREITNQYEEEILNPAAVRTLSKEQNTTGATDNLSLQYVDLTGAILNGREFDRGPTA